jgi:hypothetical protein
MPRSVPDNDVEEARTSSQTEFHPSGALKWLGRSTAGPDVVVKLP